MTSQHKLLAVLCVCLAVASVAANIRFHEGCIAFCTNIAQAGRAD